MPDLPLLVLVHPGSLCGSANFNLGAIDARMAREDVASVLQRHEGAFLVVEGGFDDELSSYPMLQRAIAECLDRNQMAGHTVIRHWGPDDALDGEHFTDTLPSVLQDLRRTLGDVPVALTGAWYHPEDETGCVGACRKIAEDAGFCIAEVVEEVAELWNDDAGIRAVRLQSYESLAEAAALAERRP